MRLLFLDDSFNKQSWYLGYGGYVIDSTRLNALRDEFHGLKEGFGIPQAVELKWSPPPEHFLRTKFTGVRHDLYRACVSLLSANGTQVMCAAHALKECYGVSLHGWDRPRASRWAAKQQLRFLAERFERPILKTAETSGMIVVDQFGDDKDEAHLIQGFSMDMLFGTEFEKLERIAMVPLATASHHCPFIQLADVVTGIIVSALGGAKYGTALFADVAKLFLYNPHEGSSGFSSLMSSAVLGFGFKLFPVAFTRRGRALFAELDEQFIITNTGLKGRSA